VEMVTPSTCAKTQRCMNTMIQLLAALLATGVFGQNTPPQLRRPR
jgi:hypothetical protein